MGAETSATMKRSPEEAEVLAATELRIGLLSFQRRTEEITRRHGLTPERYLLLLIVRTGLIRGEQTTVTSLGRPLQMTQSSVSRLVGGAVRAGLVRREIDPHDHRRSYLSLTRSGDARLEAALRELGPERAKIAEVLPS